MNDKEYAINEGYKNLATAIVKLAIDDKVKPTHPKPTTKDLEYLDKFFSSQWCGVLSGIDEEELQRIIRIYKEQIESGIIK